MVQGRVAQPVGVVAPIVAVGGVVQGDQGGAVRGYRAGGAGCGGGRQVGPFGPISGGKAGGDAADDEGVVGAGAQVGQGVGGLAQVGDVGEGEGVQPVAAGGLRYRDVGHFDPADAVESGSGDGVPGDIDGARRRRVGRGYAGGGGGQRGIALGLDAGGAGPDGQQQGQRGQQQGEAGAGAAFRFRGHQAGHG